MRLYIGNLPYAYTQQDLKNLFSAYTVSSANVITDRDTGKSKGFGFVEIPNDQEAQEAIKALHGKDVAGKILTVNEARPPLNRDSRGGREGGREGGGGGRDNRYSKAPRGRFGSGSGRA